MKHTINYKSYEKRINTIPFHLLVGSEAKGVSKDIIVAKLGLSAQAEWILPACLAYIEKNLILVRNSEGLISAFETLKKYAQDNPENLEWFRGMLGFLTLSPRKQIVGSMIQTRNLKYSALVPLVLSVFKEKRGVQYSEWDWQDKGMKFLVDEDLLSAVVLGTGLTENSPHYSLPKEDILKIREYSLMYKTGSKSGELRLPTNTYSVTTRTGDSEYNALPRLRKIMDCQIWIAHPSLRHSLMILDPRNLDSMPEPLIQEEFIPPLKLEEKEVDMWKELGLE